MAGQKSRKPYKAGIVGCGRIAGEIDKDPLRKYVATHAGAYSRLSCVDLVSACDIDMNKLKAFGDFWKVDRLYRDVDEMLTRENLDILSICTWPGTHYDIAQLALKRGIKAIFCEKPITDNLAQADALVRNCQRKGVILAVNHSRRWDEGHQKVKEFLDCKKLGKIRTVSCYYTAGLSNTGTHLFDLLRFFLGEAKWVYACPQPVFGRKDPTISGEIFFESGILVSLVGLDVRDYLIFEIDFYGSKGRIRIKHSGFDMEYWKVGKSPFFSGYRELIPGKISIHLRKKTMMINAITNLVNGLESAQKPLCSGDDGRKSLEIVCALHQSMRSAKAVQLPLSNRKVGI